MELSKNITLAIKRLIELKYAYNRNFNSVIVGSEKDLNLTAKISSLLGVKNEVRTLRLQYLTIDNLIEALKHKDKYGSTNSGLMDLFFNFLLKNVESHGLVLLQ